MKKTENLAASFRQTLQAKRAEEDTPSPVPTEVAPSPIEMVSPSRKRGPNGGKRTDKLNYCQTSVYIKIETRKRVRRALEDKGSGQDVSMLIQELLEQWLNEEA